jgi:hypothetical protein
VLARSPDVPHRFFANKAGGVKLASTGDGGAPAEGWVRAESHAS